MKLTYTGIANFCAGFFLSFGFARSYYSPAPEVQPAVKKPVAHAHGSHHTRTPASTRSLSDELTTPRFTNLSDLKFNQKSGVFVRWSEVPNADTYMVTISDSAGKKVREYKTKRSFTLLKTLGSEGGETNFSMRVAAVSADKELGPPSEAKKLLMELTNEVEAENTVPHKQVDSESPPAPVHAKVAPVQHLPIPKIELKPPSIKSISTED